MFLRFTPEFLHMTRSFDESVWHPPAVELIEGLDEQGHPVLVLTLDHPYKPRSLPAFLSVSQARSLSSRLAAFVESHDEPASEGSGF